MNKVLLSLLFVGGVLPATFAAAQTSMSADDMLRSNELVMDALMQRIQRINDVSDRQTLIVEHMNCLLYTSPSPRDRTRSRMPSSA